MNKKKEKEKNSNQLKQLKEVGVKSKAGFFGSVYSDVETKLKQFISSDLSRSYCIWFVFKGTLFYSNR